VSVIFKDTSADRPYRTFNRKPTNLASIIYKKKEIEPGARKLKHKRVVYGFDTETNNNGEILCLCASNCSSLAKSKEEFEINAALGEHCLGNKKALLDMLTQQKYEHSCNVFFNLNYDNNALYKTIFSEQQLRILAKVETINAEYSGIQISAIKNKELKLKIGRRVFIFNDIACFYRGVGAGTSLQDGSLPATFEGTFSYPYTKKVSAKHGFTHVTPELLEYCKEDAYACFMLGENLSKLTNEHVVPIAHFTSMATISKALLRRHLLHRTLFKPTQLQQAAMNSYSGGHIEIMQRGPYGIIEGDNTKVYTYDINSAYPAAQSQLQSVVGKKVSDKPEYIPDSLHSFFKVAVDIEPTIASPIKFRFDDSILYPSGYIPQTWIDKNEYEL
jgi:hypothetical protein